ncbi:hypothetical protein CAPTEDRAFT_154287 [Capitella teleta]|uniref:Uncharacterized protein n=1 Tax=Capitella teleta TaxID=283909 RepID=R7T518_CAPTE|nr:hypothetical protein CAPTEDRAFT_154287 [Capitella teleta]|eukprot:ELT88252.1 hypothetical protein CAPTEDRAFT_154287 [Capitella teleta]
MASFTWKQKVGERVNKRKSRAFEEEAAEDDAAEVADGSIDWLSLQALKRSKVISLEDAVAKAHRLTSEGTVLAEAERFWEAITKWDEALQWNPKDGKVYEMKAQAYMQLSEVYPAVSAANKSVELAPLWWVSHQTLGRALLGLGEVQLAARSFCRAVHLAPDEVEVLEEDLPWVLSLKQQQEEAKKELSPQPCASDGPVKLVEIADTSSHKSLEIWKNPNSQEILLSGTETSEKTLCALPRNYVYMRR